MWNYIIDLQVDCNKRRQTGKRRGLDRIYTNDLWEDKRVEQLSTTLVIVVWLHVICRHYSVIVCAYQAAQWKCYKACKKEGRRERLEERCRKVMQEDKSYTHPIQPRCTWMCAGKGIGQQLTSEISPIENWSQQSMWKGPIPIILTWCTHLCLKGMPSLRP